MTGWVVLDAETGRILLGSDSLDALASMLALAVKAGDMRQAIRIDGAEVTYERHQVTPPDDDC